MRNEIILTLAKLKLSESRLFQYCLAHYDSRSDENPTFKATVNDLKKYLHINNNTAYDVIRQAVIALGSRPWQWQEENILKVRNWFDGFDYHINEGRFEFKINRDAKPYFLMLKEFFTRYRPENTRKFKHAASFELYVNLKQWEKAGKWKVGLDKLKDRLGVAGKYSRWSDFSRWFLQPSVDEINEHSDLSVIWEPTKTGRRVAGVAFKIRIKPDIAAQNAREIHETNKVVDDILRLEKKEKTFGFFDTPAKKTGLRYKPNNQDN